MAKKNSNKYFLKNTSNGSFVDVTTLFDGVNILSVTNFDARGKAVNVYHAQWLDSDVEDFIITTLDSNNNPTIVRENVDIKVVFIVGQRYANSTIDTQTVYDNFVEYMTNTDIWIASTYFNKQVHCVASDKFEPQKTKLHRGNDSYIIGEITLNTLAKPQNYTQANAPYDYIILDRLGYATDEDCYADAYHLIYDGLVDGTFIQQDVGDQEILIYEPLVNDESDQPTYYFMVIKNDLLDILNNGRYGSSIELIRGDNEYFGGENAYSELLIPESPRRVLRSFATEPDPVHIYELFA